MRTLTAKYAGTCKGCGADLAVGQTIGYDKPARAAYCLTCAAGMDAEDIRAAREARAETTAARLVAKAERLEADASGKMAEWERNREDIAYVTQPANPHRGFGKQRQTALDRYAHGSADLAEARELRERAAHIERTGGHVAGDAERKRQAIREQRDTVITKGSRVHDFCFGTGTVVGVYKVSYRVRFDASGSTYARDKSFVRPIKDEGA